MVSNAPRRSSSTLAKCSVRSVPRLAERPIPCQGAGVVRDAVLLWSTSSSLSIIAVSVHARHALQVGLVATVLPFRWRPKDYVRLHTGGVRQRCRFLRLGQVASYVHGHSPFRPRFPSMPSTRKNCRIFKKFIKRGDDTLSPWFRQVQRTCFPVIGLSLSHNHIKNKVMTKILSPTAQINLLKRLRRMCSFAVWSGQYGYTWRRHEEWCALVLWYGGADKGRLATAI